LVRVLALLLAWGCAVLASAVINAPPSVRAGAAVVHVLSLVVAFGAVIVIDWHGLLWLAGRRGLHESTRLAAGASPLIWLGLLGLLASGALLDPDLSSPLAWTKLLLVLVVSLNGAFTSTTARLLRELPPTSRAAALPRQLQARVISSTAISQAAWCGAIAIGFSTAIGRS
jgi:hypothetical protein